MIIYDKLVSKYYYGVIFMNKDLIELYSTKDSEDYLTDVFALGYVLKEFNNFILFMSINEIGMLESIQIRNKEHVLKMVGQTEYTNMFSFFIEHSKSYHVFDPYSLEKALELKDDTSVSDLLNQSLKLGQTISIITAIEDKLLVGKIVLLHTDKLVLSLVNYENMKLKKKQTIHLDDVICIDLFSIENHLYDTFHSQ